MFVIVEAPDSTSNDAGNREAIKKQKVSRKIISATVNISAYSGWEHSKVSSMSGPKKALNDS